MTKQVRGLVFGDLFQRKKDNIRTQYTYISFECKNIKYIECILFYVLKLIMKTVMLVLN